MKKINKEQFIKLVSNINKETKIIVKSTTKVKMNKKGNPYYDKVIKNNIGEYNIGFSYEEKIKKIDPDYEVKENKVGNHLNKSILFNENTKKHYLFCEPINTIKTDFEFAGKSINSKLFEPFLPKKSDSLIKINSFCLDNIKSIKLNNEEEFEII